MRHNPLRRAAFIFVILFGICALSATAARAQLCTECDCEDEETAITETFIELEEGNSRAQIDAEFSSTGDWLVDTLYQKNLLPWLQAMTLQMSTIGMQQTLIFGALLDAKEQLEVQRLFQQLTARAHKDYQPSVGVCAIGTNIRSLAATERLGELNSFVLAQQGEGRNTAASDTSAAQGEESDRPSRLTQFRKRYCDQNDNGGGLSKLCPDQAPAATVNRDVDYSGVMEHGLTLNLDLGNVDKTVTHPTDDEQDVVALGNNLYGEQAPSQIPEVDFNTEGGTLKPKVLDQRSVTAERNVAAASFYTVAGMKAMGTPANDNNPNPPPDPTNGTTLVGSADTVKYMNVILKQLGVSDTDIPGMLGTRPSYYAQMELLTKKVYQDPAFYTELYDTPANVQRKKVALQAIGLMQDFDTLQSYLRTEMMLSQILEMEVIKLQTGVQDELARMGSEGVKGKTSGG